MHSNTLIPNSIPTTTNHHDYDDLEITTKSPNSISTTNNSQNHDDNENPQFINDYNHSEIALDTEPEPDNNPPDSFWVSNNKVTDWLNHHTFIERKASVKLVAVSRNFDPVQTRSSQRSVSFNHKPKTTIIGFRQKPGHNSDGKLKQNDRLGNLRSDRLFKNRSVPPGKSSVLQVTEPKSPRVSCIGRVGSMRGKARKIGFWRTVKAAILNRVRTNKVPKKDR